MAYNGLSFVFDGIPSEEYGLVLYDLTYSVRTEGMFASPVSIVEDRTAARYKPLFYGTTQNSPLEFTMTFGANQQRSNNYKSYDRYDLSVIASWLTGHNSYKWLEITQPDMEVVRYKCIITKLSHIELDLSSWAFSCTVHCDSPFAYTYPETITYLVNGTADFVFRNRSTYNGYYMPKLVITLDSGYNTFSIINHSDNDRLFKFTNVPSTPLTITIDNENEVITNTAGLNLYPYFNYNFFRLLRGDNQLEISGSASVKIYCEFPMNVGG
ncbi:MAG: phage tail family protein [Endomicrobiaceae bacterium]|nr:phage tail family protein [Endomicrobiaceae bacterium]